MIASSLIYESIWYFRSINSLYISDSFIFTKNLLFRIILVLILSDTLPDKIYGNDVYLNYLRYNPRWYVTLNENPASINDFEKEVKINLKMTTSDKIENLRKQIDFINGMLKYLNS